MQDFILIEQYISDDLQDELFTYTRKIKSRRVIVKSVTKETILKDNDRYKIKM